MIQGFLPNEITLHDIIFWVDGLNGVIDRKTKTAYSTTGITISTFTHAGGDLTFDNSTSVVEIGDTGETIKSVSFWVNPTTNTEYFLTVGAGGSAETIDSDTGTLAADNWTSPTIYINGAATTTLPTGSWSYVTVNTATGFAADNVLIGQIGANFMQGKMTHILGSTKEWTLGQHSQVYNKFK